MRGATVFRESLEVSTFWSSPTSLRTPPSSSPVVLAQPLLTATEPVLSCMPIARFPLRTMTVIARKIEAELKFQSKPFERGNHER